jgi:hypothetical protein
MRTVQKWMLWNMEGIFLDQFKNSLTIVKHSYYDNATVNPLRCFCVLK